MAHSESFMGTQIIRPYTKDLVQVTIPREIAAMLRVEAGNRMWAKVIDDGFAFVIKGPMPQINPPLGPVDEKSDPSGEDGSRR